MLKMFHPKLNLTHFQKGKVHYPSILYHLEPLIILKAKTFPHRNIFYLFENHITPAPETYNPIESSSLFLDSKSSIKQITTKQETQKDIDEYFEDITCPVSCLTKNITPHITF